MFQLFECWSIKKATGIAVFFLLFLSFMLSLHADFSWVFPPTVVSNRHSVAPSVNINNAGQAVVVWIQGSQIFANRHTPEGGWIGPVALSSASVEDVSAAELRVIVNQSGQALVMWEGQKIANSKYYLRFATMETWGSWSGAQDVPGMTAQANVFFQDFAFNNSGNAIVAWSEEPTGGTYILKATTFTFNTGWKSNPETIGPVSLFFKVPVVAMNDRGEAIVAWSDTNAVKAANLSETGNWTIDQTIATPDEALLVASVAMNNLSNTEAVVAWTFFNGTTVQTRAARWTRTGGWIAAETVFAPPAGWGAEIAPVSINDAHQVAVTWTNESPVPAEQDYVRVATKLFSGPTWTIQEVSGARDGDLFNPSLVLDSQGQMVIVWSDDNEGMGNSGLRSSNTIFGAEWSVPMTLSESSDDVGALSFDGSNNGIVMVAWTDDNTSQIKTLTGLYPPKPPGGIGKGSVGGKQKKNKFLTQTEYYNHVEWSPSPSLFVSYNIFANGAFVATTPHTFFDHRGQKKKRPVVYSISAVNVVGQESDKATGVVP